MIRKSTAIFFILLANLILLAHVVVPHHHHENKVCINASHCHSENHAHTDGAPAEDHEHDGENSSSFCVLKQAVFIVSNHSDQIDKCLFGTDKSFTFLDFQALIPENGSRAFAIGIATRVPAPLITTLHSRCVSTSIGLRAPPTV